MVGPFLAFESWEVEAHQSATVKPAVAMSHEKCEVFLTADTNFHMWHFIL